jgi:hypothetical protein
MLLRSIATQVSTPQGPKIINETIKRISSPPNKVYKQICDFKSWNQWISPQSKFTSGVNEFTNKNQSCLEIFGLFDSSSIQWTVSECIPHQLSVFCSSSKGTFGWDNLKMDFIIIPDPNDDCKSILTFKYSWVVSNPIVAFIEKLVIRQSMISDNIQAIYKLTDVCEAI